MKRCVPRFHSRAALRCAAASAVAAIAPSALAQSSIAFNGGTYNQNFDSLPAVGTVALTGAGPHNLSAAPVGAFNMPGWYSADFDAAGNYSLIASAGTSNTGALYSFGPEFDIDRALGSISSGTVIPGFGAVFVNNTAATITQFTLNYTGEQWRRGNGTANTLAFSYNVGATSINAPGFIAAPQLNFTSPVTTGTNTALDGNMAQNRVAISNTVTGISWGFSQTLVIRWLDTDDGSFDDGLGIDGLSLVAGGVGARNLVWNPAGTGGTNWVPGPPNTNWLDGASAASFANGDNANFTQAGVGNVNVDAGGVQPAAVNVSNSSSTYTIAGGPIGGTGQLTKTGAGSLVLSSTNGYTGGTVINDGVLVAASDATLGTGNITMGGGSLQLGSNFNSARSITLSASSTSTVNTGAFDGTFSSAGGAGSLRKVGTGTLRFNGAYNIGGSTTVTGGTLSLGQGAGSVNLATTLAGTDFGGNLAVLNGIRVNFNGGVFGGPGAGKVYVLSNNSTLAVSNGVTGVTPVINKDIVLNPNSLAGPFMTSFTASPLNTLTVNGIISGDSDVVYASTGTVILSAANTYTGNTIIQGSGSLVINSMGNLGTSTNPIGFNDGVLRLNAANFVVTRALDLAAGGGAIDTAANNATISLSVSGTGPFTKHGSGQLNVNNVRSGGLTVNGGELRVLAGATPVLPAGVSDVEDFAVAGGPATPTARLDLTNNGMITDGVTEEDVRNYIRAGHNGGAWNGNGIATSSGTASTHALGFALVSDLGITEFATLPVQSTDTIIRFTRYGDANVDGLVNLVDYNRLAANFGDSSDVFWFDGDFNYDGQVNLIDYNRLAGNFALTAGPDGPTPQDWAALASVVPEPGVSMVALAAGAMSALRRTRRR